MFRGSNPGGGEFSTPVHTDPGAHPASYTMGIESFPEVKRPKRGVEHPPPSNAEVIERVDLYLYSPSEPSWPVLRWTLTLPCYGQHKLQKSLNYFFPWGLNILRHCFETFCEGNTKNDLNFVFIMLANISIFDSEDWKRDCSGEILYHTLKDKLFSFSSC